MDNSQPQQGRGLTLALTIISLTNNTLFAILLQSLPTDPLHLITSLSLYSIYAALVSLLGLIGTIRNSSLLITIFSQHLLLDTLLSNISRFLLIQVLTSFSGTFCSDLDYEPRHIPSSSKAQEQCRYSVWALQGFFAAIVMGMTGVQWLCAIRVRRYARGLVVEERDRIVDVEKRGIGDEKKEMAL